MRPKNEPESPDNFVLLGMAGIPEPEILAQVEMLTRSPAFENQGTPKKLLRYLVNKALEGKVPRPAEIAKALFNKEDFGDGDSIVRNPSNKLRKCLTEHYAHHAKPDEIRLHIRDREYVVFAPPRRPVRSTVRHSDSTPAADVILEPEDNSNVYAVSIVRGRLGALSLDTRAWLVLRIPVGVYYPQCRVSRETVEWQHEVQCGSRVWGVHQGAVFDIQLVAVGMDGDIEFYRYLKSEQDGFGRVLPSDCRVLDTKRVTRRDIRDNEPGKPSA